MIPSDEIICKFSTSSEEVLQLWLVLHEVTLLLAPLCNHELRAKFPSKDCYSDCDAPRSDKIVDFQLELALISFAMQ